MNDVLAAVLRVANRWNNWADYALFGSYPALDENRDIEPDLGLFYQSYIQSLANDLGSSRETIKRWISVLETLMVVYRLQPYFENFGKRIIKSPKFYFTDTGLLANLLGLTSVEQIERDPLRGAIFENLIVTEALKTKLVGSSDPKIYFYGDSNPSVGL